jgi:hypothetical protein
MRWILLLSSAGYAFSQTLSVGVVGGATLTEDFRTTTLTGSVIPGLNPTLLSRAASSKVLVGPSAEWNFTERFGIEVNALFRPVTSSVTILNTPEGTVGPLPKTHSRWQFPILAKYRFEEGGAVTPFVAGGATFRTADSWNVLSQAGVTAGAGIENKISRFRYSPGLRYTRWGEAKNRYYLRSTRNQLESIVGLGFWRR